MQNTPQLDYDYLKMLVDNINPPNKISDIIYCSNCCSELGKFMVFTMESGDICCEECGSVVDHQSRCLHQHRIHHEEHKDRKLIEDICGYSDDLISSVLGKLNLIYKLYPGSADSRGPGKQSKIIVCFYYALMERSLSLRPMDLCAILPKGRDKIGTKHINTSIAMYMTATQRLESSKHLFHPHGTADSLIPSYISYLKKRGNISINIGRLKLRSSNKNVTEDIVLGEISQFTRFLSENIIRFARALPFSVAMGVIYICIILQILELKVDGIPVELRNTQNVFSGMISISKSTICSLYKHFKAGVIVDLYSCRKEDEVNTPHSGVEEGVTVNLDH